MKKKVFMIVCIAVLAIRSNAQLTTICTGLRHPESVISDGKFLYVTEIGTAMAPLASDSDGAVAKLDLDGKLISENIAKIKLNAPKGTSIINHILFVADLDRIVGIDLRSGKAVTVIDFSKFNTHFINDITVKDKHTLLATASDIGKVFEVDLYNNNFIKMLAIRDIQGANGILYDIKTSRAYINGLGTMDARTGIGVAGYIDWQKGEPQFHQYRDEQGFFDGMVVLKSGNIIVSDWVDLSGQAGILKEINVKNNSSKILSLRKIFGPADIFYDKEHKQLYIPATMEQSLLKLSLID